MRIRLEHPDRAPYWLAGNPALNGRTEQTEGLKLSPQLTRNGQAAGGAGWDAQMMFDRGNQKVIFDADLVRGFDTEIECMDFIARLGALDRTVQEHEWWGDVWLRLDDGATYKEWQLPKAKVSLSGLEPRGVSVQLRYRIEAGGFGATRSGGINLTTLEAYTTADPAVVVLSAAALDAMVTTADPEGYPGSYLEISMTRNGPGDVVSKQWQIWSTGDPVGEYPPLSEVMGAIYNDWISEHGTGMTATPPDPGDWPVMYLTLESQFTGPQAWVQVSVIRGPTGDYEQAAVLYDEGEDSGLITLTGDDDEPLIADLG